MSSKYDEYKRWYDRHAQLAQAVRVMVLFPDAIRSVISEGVISIANREFRVNEKMNSFKTLGAEKVLGVYKSKNKRREYDENPMLHKTMNYLYILSEENQDYMAKHILLLVNYIQQYLTTCQVMQVEVSVDDVAALTTTYVEKGTSEVEKFLERIRHEFHQKLLQMEAGKPPVDFLDDLLEQQGQDLIIRHQD